MAGKVWKWLEIIGFGNKRDARIFLIGWCVLLLLTLAVDIDKGIKIAVAAVPFAVLAVAVILHWIARFFKYCYVRMPMVAFVAMCVVVWLGWFAVAALVWDACVPGSEIWVWIVCIVTIVGLPFAVMAKFAVDYYWEKLRTDKREVFWREFKKWIIVSLPLILLGWQFGNLQEYLAGFYGGFTGKYTSLLTISLLLSGIYPLLALLIIVNNLLNIAIGKTKKDKTKKHKPK